MNRKPEKPDNLVHYMNVVLSVYRDCAALCALSASSVSKDCETLIRRTQSEGMSFLTKALPSLGKSLDKALSQDVSLPSVSSFALARNGYPHLFNELWQQIFDVDPWDDDENSVPTEFLSGKQAALTDDISSRQVNAVRAIRQICFLLYKLEGSHSIDDELATLDRFKTIENGLPAPGDPWRVSEETRRALENARLVLCYILKDLDLEDIIPKHGPGAVATGEKPWEKYKFSRFYEKLDRVYSYPDYFFYNYNQLALQLDLLESLQTCDEATAKVVLVPKDSRGPRIISMEPLELQWIQQGQMRSLVKHIERNQLTEGYVNFTSQEINRDLALKHSNGTGEMVTIDMQDASDRVSLRLVQELFPSNVVEYLCASRSDNTLLPDGTQLRLKKFAPMGSAVCFPIEALIFWALAVGTSKDVLCVRDLYRLPSVYVFGDDIILSKDSVDRVTHVYEELSLRVNRDKCCVGRFFRESCGMDAYKQCIVTPVRHKKRFNPKSPVALLAYCAYLNEHKVRGHERTCSLLRGRIIHEFGQLPVTNARDKYPLAFFEPGMSNVEVQEFNSRLFKVRTNKSLQRLEMKLPTPYAPHLHVGEPDWGELLRSESQGSPDPLGFFQSQFSPCDYTIPQQTRLRWTWVDVSRLVS